MWTQKTFRNSQKNEKLIRPLMEKGFIKFIDGDYFLTEKIDT